MLYAKQIDPQYQKSHVDFYYEELVDGAIYGNNNLTSHVCFDFETLLDSINEMNYDELNGIMDNDEELCDLLYYKFPRFNIFDCSKYNIGEAISLGRAILDYIDFKKNEDLCKILTIVSGEEWDWKEIHGSSQSEWNYFFYCKKTWKDEDIAHLEMDYFNLGSEWMVADNEDMEDLTYIYCYGSDDDSIRKEIANNWGCEPKDVKMLRFDGYERTPKYREV